MPLVEQPDYWICDLCGQRCGMVDNDVDERDTDPRVPGPLGSSMGWVRIDLTWMEPNPDLAEWEAHIDMLAQQLLDAQLGGMEVDPAEREAALAAARSTVALEKRDSRPPSLEVVGSSHTLCQDCRGELTRLDIRVLPEQIAADEAAERAAEAARAQARAEAFAKEAASEPAPQEASPAPTPDPSPTPAAPTSLLDGIDLGGGTDE